MSNQSMAPTTGQHRGTLSRRLLLGLCLGSLLMSGETMIAQAAQPSAADQKLTAYFQNYLDLWMAQRPLDATMLGNHSFDDVLEDTSAESRREWVKLTRSTLEGLPAAVDYNALSRDAQIDYEIFRHHLEKTLWNWEYIKPYETDPRIYGDYISNNIFLLLTQSTLPRERNIANATSRLRYVGPTIEAAKANIQHAPRVVMETAIRQNKGAISFYETGIFDITGDTPNVSPLKEASQLAVKQLKEYQTWLEKEALPKADGEWRLGKERYFQKLEMDLEGAFTADEVLKEAESEFARVQRDMYVIARQLWATHFPAQPLPPDDEAGRSETIRKVVARVSENHSQPDQLIAETRETISAIKEMITAKDILRLPEPDRCQIIEMPEFQRGNSVAYLNPAPPLDPEAASVYAVSPPPADWDEARKTSFLQEYNRQMLKILSIHEAYPGHYVQLEYSNRHPSLIRKILWSGVFAEGWAVYTEQMMLDQGFGDSDPALRLIQLKFYLRAVTNAILDQRLHAWNMTDEEAMSLMIDGAYQSEGEAVGKLVRAKQTSCQLSTYFVGRMAFYRLRQQIQRELGDQFDLGRFHEAVLDHGTLPVKYLPELVRKRLAEPR